MPIPEDKAKLTKEIRELISHSLGVDENEVTLSANFVDDLGADSLDIVEVVMELEEEYAIQIPDDDVDTIRTVGQAIDYVYDSAKHPHPAAQQAPPEIEEDKQE